MTGAPRRSLIDLAGRGQWAGRREIAGPPGPEAGHGRPAMSRDQCLIGAASDALPEGPLRPMGGEREGVPGVPPGRPR
jgi:hypothetical protein